MLVVLVALLGFAVEALLGVQQIAGLVPDVTQCIDIKRVGNGSPVSIIHNHFNATAVLYGIAYLGKAYALLFHEVLELLLVLVTHLDDYAGILGKERLHHITVLAKVVQVDVQAAFLVGEAHL